jgi:trigger factor
VTVTVTDAGPFEKIVGFGVTEADIEAAKTRAARRLSQQVKIRGFRPGKAPRPIVEATVGPDRLRAEAIDDLLPSKLAGVLDELAIEPAVTPALESMDDASDGIDVRVRVTLWPTLDSVPEHGGRTVEVGAVEISEEELSAQLDRIRDQFAELSPVDRAAATGDYVTIDLSASAGGADVAEARAAQIMYEVGSGGFIEGIDDVLEGAAAGATLTFDAPLPDGFGEQAGQAVTFQVVVDQVQEKVLPELTDEWVSEVTEFSSVAELEVNLEERMTDMKRRVLAARFREMAVDGLVDQVEVDLPEALVREEMDDVLHRFVHRLETQGITLDDYFSVTQVPREDFLEDLRLQADRSIRTRLLLEAIARKEGFEVSSDEISAVIESVAAGSQKPDQVRRALRSDPQEKSLSGDILRNKALAAIIAGAAPVDEQGNPVDLTLDPTSETEPGEAPAEVEPVAPVAAGAPLPGGPLPGVIAAGIPVEGVVEAEVVTAAEVVEGAGAGFFGKVRDVRVTTEDDVAVGDGTYEEE